VTVLNIDYESKGVVDLPSLGLDLYTSHPETAPLMAAWSVDDSPTVQQWEAHRGRMPAELRDALTDPHVEKHAFNSQFERVFTRRVMKIKTPIASWRCTMAFAYMHSFAGRLDQVGEALGLPTDKVKSKDGKRLINLFCKPQKITKANPHLWRDWRTDPEDWQLFLDYNRQDVTAEMAIWKRLAKFPVGPDEWKLYEIDQRINDRGKPVDMEFVEAALEMVDVRKRELHAAMIKVTDLENPNSTQQLLPWLKVRGYPFDDLRKDTVTKVVNEHENKVKDYLEPAALATLKLRQWAARTSTKKFDAIKKGIGTDGRMRYLFAHAGASRTLRWAGRRIGQNIPRTPKSFEEPALNTAVRTAIKTRDWSALSLYVDEPMEAFVGSIRSAFATEEGKEFKTSDLSSIESAVIGWLARCTRLLNVFRDGRDPYKDFATDFYRKAYEDISKEERRISKPPTLGCGFGLGGGDLVEGKRTGLWGYAEAMGVDITRDEAHRGVKVFRTAYKEVPVFWDDCFRAVKNTLLTKREHRVGYLRFEYRKPFLIMWLPNESPRYYHLPRIEKKTFKGRDGEPYTKECFTYMGQNQKTGKWGRITSYGPKIVENAVQSVAREVLGAGMIRAHDKGFFLVADYHDELVTEHRIGDNQFTVSALEDEMKAPNLWSPGLPLGAAGWSGPYYRK